MVLFLVKKGELEEIMSYAIHADDPSLYSVIYKDLENLIEVKLDEWLEISKEENIPPNRIMKVKKGSKTLFARTLR